MIECGLGFRVSGLRRNVYLITVRSGHPLYQAADFCVPSLKKLGWFCSRINVHAMWNINERG
jgi:hypothetical protein